MLEVLCGGTLKVCLLLLLLPLSLLRRRPVRRYPSLYSRRCLRLLRRLRLLLLCSLIALLRSAWSICDILPLLLQGWPRGRLLEMLLLLLLLLWRRP